MAELRSFRGFRYTPAAGPTGTLAAPPYDVIGEEQRQRLASRNPRNIVHLILPQGGEDRYRLAAERMETWMREGVLAQERDPSLYLYRQTFKGPDGRPYVRTGFLGLVRLEATGGSVRHHELTLAKPLEDRLRLVRTTRAHFSPVFLLYSDPEGAALRALEARATAERPPARLATGTGLVRRMTELTPGAPIEFNDDEGVRHWVQPISDEAAIGEARRTLAGRPVVIADGHHRYSAALEYAERMRRVFPTEDPDLAEGFMLACFVRSEDPGLLLLPIHRIVPNLPGDPPLDVEDLLARLSARFEIQSLQVPVGAHSDSAAPMIRHDPSGRVAIGARFAGDLRLHVLLLRAGEGPFANHAVEEPLRGLDVAILHNLILEPEFGIDEAVLKRGGRLIYEKDSARAAAVAASGEARAVFFLRPVLTSAVFDITAHGLRLPQKSTYFTPKLASGLVLHRF